MRLILDNTPPKPGGNRGPRRSYLSIDRKVTGKRAVLNWSEAAWPDLSRMDGTEVTDWERDRYLYDL
jgi:hypothetical protein